MKRATSKKTGSKTAVSKKAASKRAASKKAATSTLTRAKHPLPAFVRAAMTRRNLMAAYKARPPYQQNDYLGWIQQAKQEATQVKRLEQMLDELAAGDRYMKMAWSPLVHRRGGS